MINLEKHWASVWGNAVSIAENRPESYSKNITLRYPVYAAFGGDGVKVTFDNYTGTDTLISTIICILKEICGDWIKITGTACR